MRLTRLARARLFGIAGTGEWEGSSPDWESGGGGQGGGTVFCTTDAEMSCDSSQTTGERTTVGDGQEQEQEQEQHDAARIQLRGRACGRDIEHLPHSQQRTSDAHHHRQVAPPIANPFFSKLRTRQGPQTHQLVIRHSAACGLPTRLRQPPRVYMMREGLTRPRQEPSLTTAPKSPISSCPLPSSLRLVGQRPPAKRGLWWTLFKQSCPMLHRVFRGRKSWNRMARR